MREIDRSQTRKITVHLTLEQARFLDQERNRLGSLVGKPFSANEVIQLLVEQHKQKMKLISTENPDSVPWMYRKLAEGAK